MAATDSAEVESLLTEFRDALHEHIEQTRAAAKKVLTGTQVCNSVYVNTSGAEKTIRPKFVKAQSRAQTHVLRTTGNSVGLAKNAFCKRV